MDYYIYVSAVPKSVGLPVPLPRVYSRNVFLFKNAAGFDDEIFSC